MSLILLLKFFVNVIYNVVHSKRTTFDNINKTNDIINNINNIINGIISFQAIPTA